MTLVSSLAKWRTRSPERTALICDGVRWTYAEFDDLSTWIAANLILQGLSVGDRVALHFQNGAELALAYYACFKSGAVSVPIGVGLKAAEIDDVLRDSGASVYIGDGILFCEQVSLRRQQTGISKWYVTPAGMPLPDEADAFNVLLQKPDRISLPTISDDKYAVILYTSGTTARPKGIVHSHHSLLGWWNMHSQIEASSDTVVVAMPLVHSGGFNAFVTSLSLGASIVLLRGFDPLQMLDAIERYRGTVTLGNPAMFHALMRIQATEARDVSSMRKYNVTGDTVSLELQRAFYQHFGRYLQASYGSTEVSPIAVAGGGGARYRLLGYPVPGVEVKILDEEKRSVPEAVVGEIVVKSPAVMVGYWKDPDRTAVAIRDGWFYTGDLGRYDECGRLWFAGRKKEIIVVAGVNVSPLQVESALCEHPAVREALVCGIPTPVKGESVAACVVFHAGMEVAEREIAAFVRSRLADYKVPEKIIVLGELPKTRDGKLSRRALAELVQCGAD